MSVVGKERVQLDKRLGVLRGRALFMWNKADWVDFIMGMTLEQRLERGEWRRVWSPGGECSRQRKRGWKTRGEAGSGPWRPAEAEWAMEGRKSSGVKVIRSQILQGTVSHHRDLDGKSLRGYDQRSNVKRWWPDEGGAGRSDSKCICVTAGRGFSSSPRGPLHGFAHNLVAGFPQNKR